MRPPSGDYIVGQASPDGTVMARHDERILNWLSDHNLDPVSVYRVRINRHGGWVFRYKLPLRRSRFRKNVVRRFPLWVDE